MVFCFWKTFSIHRRISLLNLIWDIGLGVMGTVPKCIQGLEGLEAIGGVSSRVRISVSCGWSAEGSFIRQVFISYKILGWKIHASSLPVYFFFITSILRLASSSKPITGSAARAITNFKAISCPTLTTPRGTAAGIPHLLI